MTTVDLIIPTLNGSDLLARCLETLRRSTFDDFRLIVFDDGSSEPIEQVVRSRFPDADIVRSERNTGLARAFNQCIAIGDSRYVILLNNDTEVEPDWLAEIVACAERHPDAGSVASKLRLLSDRHTLHSAGDRWLVFGMPENRGVWLEDVGQYDREEAIFSACGGAALYRRAALDRVLEQDGFVFDERFFMYCEDIDIGWRLQTLGWPCIFAPRAVVYHALSATGGGTLASYYVSRNIWLVLAASVPEPFVRPYRSRMLAYHLGRASRTLRRLREPAARASIRGTMSGMLRSMSVKKHQRSLAPGERSRIEALLSGQVTGRTQANPCYTHE